MKNPINFILAGLIGFIAFTIAGIGVAVFPWYTTELPYKIEHKTYSPGEMVKVSFQRNAVLGMTGTGRVELVRMRNGATQEVYNFSKPVVMNAGKQLVEVYYHIPDLVEAPQLASNDSEYMWQGSLTYKPFRWFAEKSLYFTSEKFHIKVPDERNASGM